MSNASAEEKNDGEEQSTRDMHFTQGTQKQKASSSSHKRKRVRRGSKTTDRSYLRAVEEQVRNQEKLEKTQGKLARLVPDVVQQAMLKDDWALVRTWVDFRASYAAAKQASGTIDRDSALEPADARSYILQLCASPLAWSTNELKEAQTFVEDHFGTLSGPQVRRMDRRELSGYMRASEGDNAMDLSIEQIAAGHTQTKSYEEEVFIEATLCSSTGTSAKAELATRLAAAIAVANPMRIQPSEISMMTKRQMCKHLSLSKYGLLLLDKFVPSVAFPTDRADLRKKHRVNYLYDQVARSDVFTTSAERTLSKEELAAERKLNHTHLRRPVNPDVQSSRSIIRHWTDAYRPSVSPQAHEQKGSNESYK